MHDSVRLLRIGDKGIESHIGRMPVGQAPLAPFGARPGTMPNPTNRVACPGGGSCNVPANEPEGAGDKNIGRHQGGVSWPLSSTCQRGENNGPACSRVICKSLDTSTTGKLAKEDARLAGAVNVILPSTPTLSRKREGRSSTTSSRPRMSAARSLRTKNALLPTLLVPTNL